MSRKLIVLIISLFGLTGIAEAAPREYIVVIDVSASRSQQDLNDAKQFLNSLVKELSFGDQVVAIQMQQEGFIDHPRRWSVNLPNAQDTYQSARDRESLENKKKGIRLILPTFFQTNNGAVLHTDIFSTLKIVSEYMRDNGGKPTTLILLSDMLQSTRGIEMDKAQRMPPDNFVPSQRKAGLLPNLPGACVVVVGADTSSKPAVRVERFWQGYLAASGARLSPNDYRFTAPASMASVCK